MLNDKGYQEVITYSFVDPKLQQLIHPAEALILPSPISSEMSAMRLSLWTGLLGTIVTTRIVSKTVCEFSKAVCALCRIIRQI